jgi:ribosomal protein L32E
MSNAKRGEVILVVTSCSYHDIKLKKHFYETYELAKAWRVKQGKVQQYKLKGQDKPQEVKLGFQTVYTISGAMQPKAETVWLSNNDGKFLSLDEAKEMIRAA